MIYAVTVYYNLGPKFGLVVRKCLALLGVKSYNRSIFGSKVELLKSICQAQSYSYWKYSRILPLIKLALSGPENALWWFLSQLLRHSFCEISVNELEGLALIT